MSAPNTAPTSVGAPPTATAAQPAAPTQAGSVPGGVTTVPPSAPTTESPKTLQEIIAHRRALVEGNPSAVETTATVGGSGAQVQNAAQGQQQTLPQGQQPAATPSEGQAPQTPAADPGAAMYQLAQTNPQQLIQMLQAMTGQAAQQQTTQTPTPAENKPIQTPQEYHQQVFNEAQQWLQQRQRITAASMFGDDTVSELGIPNTDFTNDLHNFIVSTMMPIMGNVLSNIYNLQYTYDNKLNEYAPAFSSINYQQKQRETGLQMAKEFPALGTGDTQAQKYMEKRFNELAPNFMSPELFNKPDTNPQEYARIAVAIAKIAASEYPNLSPGATQASTANSQAPAPSPEPAAIQPTYRNHLGQFQAQRAPKSLDAFNEQRFKALFPNRG